MHTNQCRDTFYLSNKKEKTPIKKMTNQLLHWFFPTMDGHIDRWTDNITKCAPSASYDKKP